MILTGRHNEYYFLQTNQEGLDMKTFITDFSTLLTDNAVAVLSFDGDSMKPTKDEYSRGWTYDELEVAYLPTLNRYELGQNIWANCYDEWYIFDKIETLKSNKIFVTFSGFRLIDINDSELMKNIQKRFWRQTEANNPKSFIINGDNFIYGSKVKNEIEEIAKFWKQ